MDLFSTYISIRFNTEVKEVANLKKTWVKPMIETYKEEELLVKMSVKAQTHDDFLDHGDAGT